MKPEIKKLWIGALRSGQYKQGKGHLCQNNRYCCLGVLYDVGVDGYWHRTEAFSENEWGVIGENGIGPQLWSGCLPPHVEFELDIGHWAQQLISMNDSGKSFEEIADFIEKNL